MPDSPYQSQSNDNVLDYLGILHRHRGGAIWAFLAVFVPAMGVTLTTTPVYEATARIALGASTPTIASLQDTTQRNEGPKGEDYFGTQYEIVRSRAIAQQVVARLKLWEHPKYSRSRGPQEESGWLSTFATNAWSRTKALFVTKPEGKPKTPIDPANDPALVDAVMSQLRVEPLPKSRLVDLTFESEDPELAANLANTLAHSYIEFDLQSQSAESKGASDFLTERLKEQLGKLDASEAALQNYRESRNAVSLEDRQNIVVAKLADLNAAVTRAKTERIAREGAYRQLMAIRNDRQALDGFPVILANSFVQQLKSQLAEMQKEETRLSEQYGDQHPEMIRVRSTIKPTEARLQAEIEKVIQAVENDYLAAEAQERSLTAALEQQKREAMGLNRMGIEYGALQRESTSNKQILESLLKETKQAGMAIDLRKSTIQIVDEAEVSKVPVRPKTGQGLLLALAGGLCVAVGFVGVKEYTDRRIRTPDQVVAALNLPFIACVPKTASAPGVNNGVPSHFGEAFRRIRTKVLSASSGERGVSIVVTSTGPKEGKSVVAANLAIALAKAKQRVLLIDADLRRPTVHRLFEQVAQPGLSELMAGMKSSERILRPTRFHGLSILPAGAQTDNPAELLASVGFRTLLRSLGEHFDWIIVDSPPILAVSDAAIIAEHASSILFVIAADQTRQDAAQVALNELASVRQKFLGAVLNRVDFEGQSVYYSRYYRPEYDAYYTNAKSDDRGRLRTSENPGPVAERTEQGSGLRVQEPT